MNIQEKNLIAELKKGNVEAFDLLYNKYNRNVYAMAYSHLKNEQESEGVVQNVFMYIWDNRSNINLDLNFKSYIFTITSNNIKKIFRSEKYSTQLKDRYKYKQENVQPDDELEYNLLLEKVDKLIDELPERKRLIFLKSRKDGLSSKEIAKELGITSGTVDNQISQAIKFLRTHIREITIVLITIFSLLY
jgi:RNA polymerase sigma-70 factor (ECF subfamily)